MRPTGDASRDVSRLRRAAGNHRDSYATILAGAAISRHLRVVRRTDGRQSALCCRDGRAGVERITRSPLSIHGDKRRASVRHDPSGRVRKLAVGTFGAGELCPLPPPPPLRRKLISIVDFAWAIRISRSARPRVASINSPGQLGIEIRAKLVIRARRPRPTFANFQMDISRAV